MLPQTKKAITPDSIDSALAESGYKDIEPKEVKTEAKSILIDSGADLKETLENMVHLMRFSDNDSVRLKATENSLTIHGVKLKETGEGNNTQVNIVFQNVEEGDKRLDSMLCPER